MIIGRDDLRSAAKKGFSPKNRRIPMGFSFEEMREVPLFAWRIFSTILAD